MAWSTAKVTAIDPSVCEPSPCLRHCSCAGEMTSQGYLVVQQGHENATGCCVVYFVITVGLLILIDDEGLHLCGLASMWEMVVTQEERTAERYLYGRHSTGLEISWRRTLRNHLTGVAACRCYHPGCYPINANSQSSVSVYFPGPPGWSCCRSCRQWCLQE